MRAVFLLGVLAAAWPAGAQGAQGGVPLTLSALEQMAVEQSPALRAAEAAVDAARGRLRQAGGLSNPVVGYTGDEFGAGSGPSGIHGFFVEQMIPLGGKWRLERAVAEREVAEASAVLEARRRGVTNAVRALFYEILAAERRVEVHQRLVALWGEHTAVTAQLFNVGVADRPDFLQAEIESRRVQIELEAARNEVFARRLQLAVLAGREDVAGRPLGGTIDDALPALERDAIVRTLLEESPQVRVARLTVERARASTAKVRRDTSPDLFFSGGAAYNRSPGERAGVSSGWEASVAAGVSIPLFNQNEGNIAAARAEERRAEAELRQVELTLRTRAAAEFASYLTARGAAESYRAEILPRAEQAYSLYLARYKEMGAAYPQVLAAQRALFDLSREYLDRLAAAWRSALRLQGQLIVDDMERSR